MRSASSTAPLTCSRRPSASMLMIRSVVRSKNSRKRSCASAASVASRSTSADSRRARNSASMRPARLRSMSLCSCVSARVERARMVRAPRKKPSSSMSGTAARKRRNGAPLTMGCSAKRGSVLMSVTTVVSRSCSRRAASEYWPGSEITFQPTAALTHSRSASRNPRTATGTPRRRAASATSWSKSGSRLALLTRHAASRCSRAASDAAEAGRGSWSIVMNDPDLDGDILRVLAGPVPALFVSRKNGGIAVKRLAFALLFLALACHKSETSDQTTAYATDTATTSTMVSNDTTGTNTGTGATGGTASTLADADKEFIVKAAQGGMPEVVLGSMAAQQGTDLGVKSFGTRMTNDHGKANDELKTLATNKGLALPTELDADARKTQDELSKKSGKDFDK